MLAIPPATSLNQKDQPTLLGLIDPIKGVAIAAIVLVHTFRGWFGWQDVHVFILLSGFLLSLSLGSKSQPACESIHWFRWARRRCSRLLPPYWIAVLMGAILLAGFQSNSNQDYFISWHRYLATWIPCLQNIDYRTMFADPNSSLWYIPFALSCYIVFPFLYRSVFGGKHEQSASWLCAPLIIAALIEFGYRAFAIAHLDGNPVGFGQGFLRIPVSVHPLDNLPKEAPFQMWAPFGFSPSRIGQLMLGVVGARCYIHSQSAAERFLFGRLAPALGLTLWLLGNRSVYLNLIGWVFADFLISFGLLLLLPSVIRSLSLRCHPFFLSTLSRLGRLSLPLFLTHLLSGYIVVQLFKRIGSVTPAVTVSLVILYPILIVALAVLLKQLDDWLGRQFNPGVISRQP